MMTCLFLHVDVRCDIGADPYAHETPLLTTSNAESKCEADLEKR